MEKSNIIEVPSADRTKIEYKIIPVPCRDERNGSGFFPSIYLVEKDTQIPIGATHLEIYLWRHIEKGNSLAAIMTAAKRWVQFLNYILEHESITGLEKVDGNILTRFAEHIRKKDEKQAKYEGEEISPDTWYRYLWEVKECLQEYYERNHEYLEFSYEPKSLVKNTQEYNRRTRKIEEKQKIYWATPPKEKPRKLRYLPEAFLPMLLYEVKRYAPHLYFANLLQAYAGLREGEIVNITWDNLVGLSDLGYIEIQITETADHVSEHKGKTPIGHIKKFRSRRVYPKFNNEIKKAYDEHLARVQLMRGDDFDWKGPVFWSKEGEILSTDSYSKDMRKVFLKHFVPDLKEYCLATGQYGIHKALIDEYEKSYIGNHAFRHWFSMYLKCHEKLDDNEIAMWRGDKNKNACKAYFHQNHEILMNFDKVIFQFQIDLFQVIKNGNKERRLEKEI